MAAVVCVLFTRHLYGGPSPYWAGRDRTRAAPASRTDRRYGRARDSSGAECIRHFPAAEPMGDGPTCDPGAARYFMDRRTLSTGVRSCCNVYRGASRHLVEDLR